MIIDFTISCRCWRFRLRYYRRARVCRSWVYPRVWWASHRRTSVCPKSPRYLCQPWSRWWGRRAAVSCSRPPVFRRCRRCPTCRTCQVFRPCPSCPAYPVWPFPYEEGSATSHRTRCQEVRSACVPSSPFFKDHSSSLLTKAAEARPEARIILTKINLPRCDFIRKWISIKLSPSVSLYSRGRNGSRIIINWK